MILAGSIVPVFPQTQLGRIIGRVTDASDAVIPDAAISADFPLTGAKTTTVSNGEGYYVLPNLRYGRYIVNVTKPGFAPYHLEDVEVASSTATTLDVKLAVTGTATN